MGAASTMGGARGAVGGRRPGVALWVAGTAPLGDAPLFRPPRCAWPTTLAAALTLLLVASAAAQNGGHKPGQGAEGPQARSLDPPPAVAPPLLEARVPGDRRFAEDELQDALVLDALAIRALRAVDDQLARPGSPCPQLLAGLRGAQLARHEAALRVQTAGALLQGEDPDELAERHATLAAQVRRSDEGIERLARTLRRRCPRVEAPTPRLWLPAEARAPTEVGEEPRVAIFVSVGAPSQVVWVDGQPRAASGPDGWAVVVTRPGTVSLCIAPPEAPRCRDLSEVYAAMGAAFELGPTP